VQSYHYFNGLTAFICPLDRKMTPVRKVSLLTPRRRAGAQEDRHCSFSFFPLNYGEWLPSLRGHFTPEKEHSYPLNSRLWWALRTGPNALYKRNHFPPPEVEHLILQPGFQSLRLGIFLGTMKV
jgi:hypothetical protein